MFLRSKFERTIEDNLINVPVNLNEVCYIYPSYNYENDDDSDKELKRYYTINFMFSQVSTRWDYDSKEDRNKEYEWILSQLDCRVNDGKPIIKKCMHSVDDECHIEDISDILDCDGYIKTCKHSETK